MMPLGLRAGWEVSPARAPSSDGMKSPAGVPRGQAQAHLFPERLGNGGCARAASMCCCRLCKFSFGKEDIFFFR